MTAWGFACVDRSRGREYGKSLQACFEQESPSQVPSHLHLLTLHTAAVALGLLTYVLVSRTGRQRRHPSAAIAWVLAIFAFPYLATPLFLLIGGRKASRPKHVQSSLAPSCEPSSGPRWAARLSEGMGLPGMRHSARIAILDEGNAALESLLELIEASQAQLSLTTFQFADDQTGNRVARALKDAAARGVRVRVLIDAIGSQNSVRSLHAALAPTGVELRLFMPLLHNPRRGRSNLRNHRKLAVADGWHVWSGGRNIADPYFVDRPGGPAWVDISFRIEGAVAMDAQRVFDEDWRLAGGSLLPGMDQQVGPSAPDNPVQLIPSGPDYADDTIHAYLLTAIHHADRTLRAATPYFVPDDALLQALVIACRRGVRVTLLIPARSNHRLADWARGRALRELAAAGATILLLPAMLHAKVVIVDDSVALCGSVNLDGRSLFLNYELSTAFYGVPEIDRFHQWFESRAAEARPYAALRPSFPRDIGEGLVRAIAFQL